MFVPFVFTLDPAKDNYYLWIFYKFLNTAKKYNWPIIAQENYFINPEVFTQRGFAETSIGVGEAFEYDVPTLDDMNKIQKYPISKEWEENLVKEYGSQSATWLYLLKERSENFEEYISSIIDDIFQKNQDTIEGIFTFCHIPSLSYVAEKRNIPVLHFEWGPLRGPVYRKTAYMNFDMENELQKRYEKFISEIQENSVYLLSRKEILSMFLDYKYIDNINLLDCRPEYEMGIACTYSMDMLSLASSAFLNNLEHITMAKRYYNEKVLAIRLHPGDPVKGRPSEHLIDNSPTAMQFITRCKRISVIASNIAFEAMLLERTAYVLGNSPYAFKAQQDLSNVNESVVDLEFVNYVIFAYLIPYELMLDVEYLRWRLTNPTEIEIYNYNLNYFLSCRGIDPKVLEESGIERLRKMLFLQGFDLSGILNDESMVNNIDAADNRFNGSMDLHKKIKYLENKLTVLDMKYKEMETTYKNQVEESSKLWNVHQELVKEHTNKCNEYNKLAKESAKLWDVYQSLSNEYRVNLDNLINVNQQCDTLLNSASWKVTAPIRYFLDKIKGK